MEKKPLYRKINKKTHNGWAWYDYPKARYRFDRGKKQDYYLPEHQSIKRKNQFSSWGSGYDYTPLFKFLHAHVGQAWNPVFQECLSRLDKPAPITWMVVNVNERGLVVDRHPNEELSPFVRCGNESYWSALWVDEDGILQYVDKDFTIEGTLVGKTHRILFRRVDRYLERKGGVARKSSGSRGTLIRRQSLRTKIPQAAKSLWQ